MNEDNQNSAGAASERGLPDDIDSTLTDKSPPPDPSSGTGPAAEPSNAAPVDINTEILEMNELNHKLLVALGKIVKILERRIETLEARK